METVGREAIEDSFCSGLCSRSITVEHHIFFRRSTDITQGKVIPFTRNLAGLLLPLAPVKPVYPCQARVWKAVAGDP